MINCDKDIGDGLNALCYLVKELIRQKKYLEADEQIRQAMCQFPHAPQPHNLMGILLEKKSDHIAAVKHFRAAWSLDPAYLPARHNLYQYADAFQSERTDAYFEEDCSPGVT
jgi:Flp pilus assembly protein TadD